MGKIEVKVYSKEGCCLCDDAKKILKKVQIDIPFETIEVDITKDSKLFEEYRDKIPVVFINGQKAFKYRVSENELRKRLNRFQDQGS